MQNSTPIQYCKYSSFLAGIFPSEPASEAKVTAAITAVGGETVRKRGYTGTGRDSPSAKALAILREEGVTPLTLSGPLTAVRMERHMAGGTMQPYLQITLGTLAGKQFLSVEVSAKAAQALVRRLTDAVPGVETKIEMYAIYGPGKGANANGRFFAEHNAKVSQNGVELKGTSPADMWPSIRAEQAAFASLKPGKAKDVAMAAAAKDATIEWHLGLLKQITTKFSVFYDERAAAMSAAAPESTSSPPPVEAVRSAPEPVTAPAPAPAPAPVAAATRAPAEVALAPSSADDYDDPFGLNEPDEPVAARPVRQPIADPFAMYETPAAVVASQPSKRQAIADPFTL